MFLIHKKLSYFFNVLTDVTHVSRFCHAEAGAINLLRPTPDRLTKHLLPMHIVQAADSSTPLRSAQNDRRIILCLCVTSGLNCDEPLTTGEIS